MENRAEIAVRLGTGAVDADCDAITLAGLLQLSALLQHSAKVVVRLHQMGHARDGAQQASLGFVEPMELPQHTSEIGPRLRVIRRQRDRPPKGLLRRAQLPAIEVPVALI